MKQKAPGKFPAAQNPLKAAQAQDVWTGPGSSLSTFEQKQAYVHKWTVPFDESGVTEALIDSTSNGMTKNGKVKRK